MRKGRPATFMIRADMQANEAEAFHQVAGLAQAVALMRLTYPDCIDSGREGWAPPATELPPGYILPFLEGIGVLPDDWFDYEVHPLWHSRQWRGDQAGAVAYVYRMRKEALADCAGR